MRVSPINNTSFKGLKVKCKFEAIPKSLDDCKTEVFNEYDIIGIEPCLDINCARLKYKPSPSKELDYFYVPLGSERPGDSYNNLLQAYMAGIQTRTVISPYIYK